MAAIPCGCTLAFPLDYLQLGEGGSDAATSTSGPTTSTMTQTSTTGQGGASGGGGSPPVTYADAVLADGPALYYRMNQATDEPNLGSIGTSADGTHAMPHAISVGVVATAEGGAATYDDPATDVNMVGEIDSGRLDVPSITPFFGAAQPFSLEVWLRLPAAFGVETANLASIDVAGGGLRLRTEANAMDAIRFGFRDMASTYADYESACYFDDWSGVTARHVVATYDPTEAHRLALYMDGVRCDTLPAPFGSQTTGMYAMPALDGSVAFGTGWSGDIDEVALYPTVLSQAAICAHYEAGSGMACP